MLKKIAFLTILLYLMHKWLYWRWISLGLMNYIAKCFGKEKLPDARKIARLAVYSAKKELGIKTDPFDCL